MDGRPFYSIIVAAYNAEKSILPTIQSVLCQTFRDFEIVIKDAKSTDNTLKMIPDDDRIRVYSEKDSGIYDGMNQAIEKASGRYLFFLNCGDLFSGSDVLQTVYNKCLKEHINGDVVAFGNHKVRGNIKKQPAVLSKAYLIRQPLCHQTVFFGSKLLKHRGYDTNYRISADYELMLYLFTNGIDFFHIDTTVCEYEGGGVSEKKENRELLSHESRAIIGCYFSKSDINKQRIKSFLTATKLRVYLDSDSSPKVLRKWYTRLVNLLNR